MLLRNLTLSGSRSVHTVRVSTIYQFVTVFNHSDHAVTVFPENLTLDNDKHYRVPPRIYLTLPLIGAGMVESCQREVVYTVISEGVNIVPTVIGLTFTEENNNINMPFPENVLPLEIKDVNENIFNRKHIPKFSISSRSLANSSMTVSPPMNSSLPPLHGKITGLSISILGAAVTTDIIIQYREFIGVGAFVYFEVVIPSGSPIGHTISRSNLNLMSSTTMTPVIEVSAGGVGVVVLVNMEGEYVEPLPSFNSIAYSPRLELFCAVSTSRYNGRAVAVSKDGRTWQHLTLSATSDWQKIIWVDELQLFVCVSRTGSTRGRQIMTSNDGYTWIIQNTPLPVISWSTIVWHPRIRKLFVYSSERVMESSNGIVWTLLPDFLINTNPVKDVLWAEHIGMLVMIRSIGPTGQVSTSVDGVVWTDSPFPVTNGLECIGYSQFRQRLIVCASENVLNGQFFESENGISWTQINFGDGRHWRSIIWVPHISRFFAVAGRIIPNLFGFGLGASSSTGLSWTIENIHEDFNSWESLASDGVSLTVAVGSGGIVSNIAAATSRSFRAVPSLPIS